eukprot:6149624-Pleurochrysis_carterae.AAC.3
MGLAADGHAPAVQAARSDPWWQWRYMISPSLLDELATLGLMVDVYTASQIELAVGDDVLDPRGFLMALEGDAGAPSSVCARM